MSSGVLIGTSVWIPFFNGIESPQVEYLKQGIRDDQPLFLCPVIIQEILQGIRSEEEFEHVKDSILAFPVPDWRFAPVERTLLKGPAPPTIISYL